MYVLYTKGKDGWLFWEHEFGWSDIDGATFYGTDSFAIEGQFLYVGKEGELVELAPLMLDMMLVLEEHKDTNLASYAGRWQLASQLASALAKDDEPIKWYEELAQDRGYSLRLYRENRNE